MGQNIFPFSGFMQKILTRHWHQVFLSLLFTPRLPIGMETPSLPRAEVSLEPPSEEFVFSWPAKVFGQQTQPLVKELLVFSKIVSDKCPLSKDKHPQLIFEVIKQKTDPKLLSLLHFKMPHKPHQLPVARRTNSESRSLAAQSLPGLNTGPCSSTLHDLHVLATLASFLLLKEHANPFPFSVQRTFLSALQVKGSFSCYSSQLKEHHPGEASPDRTIEEFLEFISFTALLIPL